MGVITEVEPEFSESFLLIKETKKREILNSNNVSYNKINDSLQKNNQKPPIPAKPANLRIPSKPVSFHKKIFLLIIFFLKTKKNIEFNEIKKQPVIDGTFLR